MKAHAFDVLVVDPPWSYGKKTVARTAGYRSKLAVQHYRVEGQEGGGEINRRTGAGIEAIIDSVPIKEWGAPDSHLYLWTTNPKLPFAFRVMEEWGYIYKTTLTWVKTTKSGNVNQGGLGWFYRGATEHVLFGVRGHKPIHAPDRRANVIQAQRGRHSEKPSEFYEQLDLLYPGERKLDVFARQERPGWYVYGDEIGPEIMPPKNTEEKSVDPGGEV